MTKAQQLLRMAKGTFWGDEHVVYLDWCVGYIDVYLSKLVIVHVS